MQAIDNYWVAMGLAQQAQDILGGDWEHQDTGAEQCQLASGEVGARVSLLRLNDAGIPVDQQQAAIDRIAGHWRAVGLDPVRSSRPGIKDVTTLLLTYPASGVTEDGFYIEVGTSTVGSTIDVRSSCGAGDADKLNENPAWRTESPSPRPSPAPGDDT